MIRRRIKEASDRVDAAAQAHHAAVLAFQGEVAAFRKTHRAPKGQYWAWSTRHGEMLLTPVPRDCTCADNTGVECGYEAVAWDDAGNAWCELHKAET